MSDFTSQLATYQKLIDDDIRAYVTGVQSRTAESYGENSAFVADAFNELLQRGGKRIRGILTLVGYEMCGGRDLPTALAAARAIEMMHAYMLIIDDIQDRAERRRGGPSIHKLLEAKHIEQKWDGDAAHTGLSLSLNAALLGLHGAEIVLSNLEVSEELRIKALNIMNHTMIVTAHGQTNDIVNEIDGDASIEDIEQVMQWKTAHYTFLNPIHMGMVLTGAGCEDTNAITQYAVHVGKAFQITDDLLIASSESGKDGKDDIKEGKRTLLTVHALKNAEPDARKFLEKCLGNPDLTDDDFEQCKQILISTGSVEFAQKQATDHITAGLASLYEHADRWEKESVVFLEDLANYIATRSV